MPAAGFVYAFFKKPQRRKERRRERSHCGDFSGDRFFNQPQRRKEGRGRSHYRDFVGDRFFYQYFSVQIYYNL
ncbi:hypothetical protein [Nostoc sp.]|uniref:hypothetical protein n=1 Tax=Nostoc sp. TaxID=1180 RepID=UPI002FFCD4E0